MVNCKEENCTTRATYGLKEKQPIYCSKHKQSNMYNVIQKICKEQDCKTIPIYGLEKGKAIYCSKHKKENMFNVKDKTCKEEECNIRPNYGLEKGKAIYCLKHKKENMFNVKDKKCQQDNCNTIPCYGLEKGKAIYCAEHKTDEMFDVKNKTCHHENCNTLSTYGLQQGKPTHCSQHQTNDMFNVKSKTCEEENCNTIPCFGLEKGNATHCFEHKSRKMFDVTHKSCISCGLFRVIKENDYYCNTCHPDKENKLRKEIIIKNLLIEHNFEFIHNNRFANDCSDIYRPDFLFECSTYYVILEVDEFCHKYKQECDLIRMNNITMSLGLPTLFIRYNPDNKTVKDNEKQKKLLEVLRANLHYEFLENIDPIYLFY
jgi:EsV-1-7 cysteine-rich motif